MATTETVSDSPRRPGIIALVDAPPNAEVIFLPTDSVGTPGSLNSQILKRLKLPVELPNEKELLPGYALKRSPWGLIVFVVTIGGRPTLEALSTNLAKALSDPQVVLARTLWVPLMGTGTGRLTYEASFNAILNQLKVHPPITDRRAIAVISMAKGISTEARNRMKGAAQAASLAIWPLSSNARRTSSLAGAPSPPGAPPSAQSSGQRLGADPYELPRSPAVTALLELATTLAESTGLQGKTLSTTLLFFALAESTSAIASSALQNDVAAEYFAVAVGELSGAHYAPAWQYYFKSDVRVSEPVERRALLRPTENVSEVLGKAKALAGAGAQSIEIDHVVEALLGHKQAGLRRQLQRMQVDPAKLLEEYRDARLGRVATKFQNDVANSEDHLDYGRYATAIHAFLTDKYTAAPLSISIQAPWGGGKSTLMHLVREELDPDATRNRYKRMSMAELDTLPKLLLDNVAKLLDAGRRIEIKPDELDAPAAKERRWTIWFNAWKYETTEQLWAGLVDAIVSQVAQRLSPFEREKFLLKLQLARIDDGIIRKRIYDRVASLWWRKAKAWALAAVSAVLALFGLAATKSGLDPALQQAIPLWSGNGFVNAIAIQLILTAGFVGSFFISKMKTRNEPAKFSLSDIIRVPDYDKGVGELHHVHADLRRVLEVVPHVGTDGKPAPLVIFIDDLDRCSPGKVASVVEGVSMLLATDDYRCIFVIGMDPQMVAAALEKAHEEVREKLPSYERAVPLGWRFMDKFVQLPFTLPPSDPDSFKSYVEWLAGAAAPDPTPARIPSPQADEPFQRGKGSSTKPRSLAADIILPVGSVQVEHETLPPKATQVPDSPEAVIAVEFKESRNVGAIIRKIAAYSIGNPREMKRMVNLARFYLTLRAARRVKEATWRPPDADQYARWIAVTLRWPDMLRWLLWGADEARWPPEELGSALVVRRLRALEEQAGLATTPDAWREALKNELNLPTDAESDWARDAKLFEFFKDENGRPMRRRLSNAAQAGFW